MNIKKAYTNKDLVETYDRRHFGGKSGRYILNKDHRVLDSLLERNELGQGLVLDIPCGTGIYATRLARSGHRVVTADASSPMLEIAVQRQDGVLGVLCDINHLPFKDNAFGVVLTLRLFQHYPAEDVGRMLHELKRAMRPGGHVVFDTFRWTPRRWPLFRRFLEKSEMYVYSHRNVEKMLQSVGLSKVQRISLYLFSPIWHRKLPMWVLCILGVVEAVVPQAWLLRTFWACTKS